MPTHCAPWPGKTNTVLPTGVVACPVTTSSPASPAASARRPAVPRDTARWSKRVRDDSREPPRSTGSVPGRASIRSASRAACARSAAGVRPDTTRGTAPGDAVGAGVGAGVRSAEAGTADPSGTWAATTTWQLAPPRPKELTPATRRSSRQERGPVTTWRFSSPRGMPEGGASKLRLAGMVPWRTARTVLSRPTTPAALSR